MRNGRWINGRRIDVTFQAPSWGGSLRQGLSLRARCRGQSNPESLPQPAEIGIRQPETGPKLEC